MRTENFQRQKSEPVINGRWAGRLAVFAAVLTFAWFLGWTVSHRQRKTVFLQPKTSTAIASANSALASKEILPLVVRAVPLRKIVYPYSLIPGGIQNIDELKSVIEKDHVVSAQYAAFQLEYARIIRLDRELKMHVTYRRGDNVYWTQRELRLAKGELLITDGSMIAMARCGNLIAPAIEDPSSREEPSEQELNTPILNAYVPGELESDNRFPEFQMVQSPFVAPSGTNFSTVGGSFPTVLLPSGPAGPLPYPGGSTPPHDGPKPPHSGFTPPPPPRIEYPLPPGGPTPPPVVKAPEPGTAIFLLAGLLALFLMHEWEKRRASKNVN